jgi:hypothetical protein
MKRSITGFLRPIPKPDVERFVYWDESLGHHMMAVIEYSVTSP